VFELNPIRVAEDETHIFVVERNVK